MNSPVLCYSSQVVAANQKALVDPSKIRNPFNTPMLVDEFRFYVLGAGTMAMMPIKVRITNGAVPLMKDFVPSTMLSRIIETQNQQGSCEDTQEMVCWRLPKPMLVMPNAPLSVQLFNDATDQMVASPLSQTVSVAVAGRSLPSGWKAPKKRYFPWAAHWEGNPAAGVDPYIESSTEADICNPHREPLNVQCFIGKIYERTLTRVRRALQSTPDIYVKIRMTTSDGTNAVRDPTPFGMVFSRTDCAWDVNTLMRPGGFVIVTLEGDYASSSWRAKSLVSMIGYREVET